MTSHFSSCLRLLGWLALGSVASAATLTVSWDDNSTTETGFKVERSVNGGNFVQIGTVAADVVTFKDATAIASSSYSYRVAAFDATTTSSYSNVASVTTAPAAVAPSIATQPTASQSVTAGTDVALAVIAAGTPTPTLQWKKNGTQIAGATTSTLSLKAVTNFDAATYTVIATNSAGTVTSSAAVLVVQVATPPPLTLTPPPVVTFTPIVPVPTPTPTPPPAPTPTPTTPAPAPSNPIAIVPTEPDRSPTITFPSAVTPPPAVVVPTPPAVVVTNPPPVVVPTPPAVVVTNPPAVVVPTPPSPVITNSVPSALIVDSNPPAALFVPLPLEPDPVKPEIKTTSSRLMNMSVRAIPGPDDRALLVGFVVESAPKSMLVRAVGPGLATYTNAVTFRDPALTLYQGTTMVGANDNWNGTDALKATAARLGAFPLPDTSKDASVLATFGPKAYTANITGAGTGLALAELYDADTGAEPAGRLINLSARAHAGSGDNVLIIGFVISGDNPLRVLIRAIGPTLANYGVTTQLTDPQLKLYKGSTLVDQNDNWGGSSELIAAFAQTGAFALPSSASKDAAMIVTLAPGAYTAIVSGAGDTNGIALAEVYELR